MTTRPKVLLTGVAVFLIAIAAVFVLTDTDSGNGGGQAQPEQANSPARGWQILPIRSASILRKAAKP